MWCGGGGTISTVKDIQYYGGYSTSAVLNNLRCTEQTFPRLVHLPFVFFYFSSPTSSSVPIERKAVIVISLIQVRKAKDTSKNGSIELNLDHGNGEVRQPVGCVHCDYTVHNAIRLFDSMAVGANRKGRYAIINAWRNIATAPIQDSHLAVCDARSVIAPDDFVPFDIVSATEVSETYHLDPGQHNFHKWYYYPNMRKQEILLFMQYDSNPMTKTRYAFHTAVRSPHAAPNAPPRESIECRCIAFFPDHTPNTIPSTIYKDNEIVSVAANEILESLKYPLHWPADARKWMASELYANGGVGRIIHELVNGGAKRKQYGLEKASKQQLDEIVKKLASESLFERTAKQNFPPK